ncbi:MAG: bifunctional oligoribonuclease/PAP phosphatase NrnA [Prevotellaceae bacterium]|jgi:phosphoesterase RecJ-like protein|nr:bifunctional oligoribonuclease/PAP phosphatase NrnA [Prevotellaceae bacterium]
MTQLFNLELYDKLQQLLKQAKNALIISHINPDGDAIGSSLGLACLLKQHIPQVNVAMPNHFPDFLKWMEGASDILIYRQNTEKVKKLVDSADIIFCLDFNNLERIEEFGEYVAQSKAPRVLIDHHLSPREDEFDLIFSHVPANSTSEIVYRISVAINSSTKIPKSAADAIYCGIMTDTGSFAHSSSNPELFRIVADLLECGVDKDQVSALVYDNFSADRMRLLGYSLNEKMVVCPQYRTAYIYLSRKELDSYSFCPGDTEGFVNYPLSIKDVVLSVFFVETMNHIKVSIRTRGNFSANEFSGKHFNGGGHKNAAGGKLFCSLSEAVKMLESILPEYEQALHQ